KIKWSNTLTKDGRTFELSYLNKDTIFEKLSGHAQMFYIKLSNSADLHHKSNVLCPKN
ncbi:hypothetical protein L9F63_018230, partial [Diploptera punctata]